MQGGWQVQVVGLACGMCGQAMAQSEAPPCCKGTSTSHAPPAPQMSIQAPPNLTPEPDDVAGSEAADPAAGWRALLDAGINDWGGKLHWLQGWAAWRASS